MAENLQAGKSPRDSGPPGREEVPLADFVPIVPEHELIRRIGAGSYGEVWLARNVVGTYRAVKVVYRKTFEHDRPYEREFGGMQKFEPVSRTHEGLVNVLQIGRNDPAGYFYYIMELADDASADRSGREHPPNFRLRELSSKPPHGLDGSTALVDQDRSEPARTSAAPINPATYKPKTLGEIARHGRLSLEECVQIVLGVTSSLAHLHRHGLVHRDIKPSNILIINGVPKLADIGLVADTSDARSYVGTEGFIPPEGPGKPQADIYSLGKVLYELSTGKDRHDFPDLPADLRDSADQSGFSEMNEIILKACASDAAQRYRSAEEMQADLALLQQGKSVKQKRATERHWVAARKIGLGVAAVAAIIFFLSFLKDQLARERSIKPEALGLYTDGWALLRQGGKQDLEAATSKLEQALVLDPAHPKIYAFLGLAYGKRAFFFDPTNQELESKAEAAADKASSLGPNLPETLFTRAYLLSFRPFNKGWRYQESIESFERILDLHPNLDREDLPLAVETHFQLSSIYLHIGLLDEALREAQIASTFEPLHSRAQFLIGEVVLYRGDYKEAVERLQRVIAADAGGNYVDLALAYLNQGLTNEARATLQEGLMKQPSDPGGQYASLEAMLFARAGEFAKAEEAIRIADQRGVGHGQFHHTAYNIACAYALMNKPKPAVEWLQRAVKTGFPCYPLFRDDPTLEIIRSDPEFQKFLDEQKALWTGYKEFHRQLVAKSRR